MSIHTRRKFLEAGALSLAGAAVASPLLRPTRLHASALALPVGLQLYSVREMLPRDFAGTLHKLRALGYQEVEAAGFFGHSAQQVSQAMMDAGLRCVSAHYAWTELSRDLNKIIDFHNQLKAEYIICSFPGFKDPSHVKAKSYVGQVQSFTMEDWRWNAEQFNKVGERVKAAGLKFGYHNHTMEFARQDGVVPFDELLRLTDASLVTIEMDCGWVTVGGGDPVNYLERYPARISMLHVKDFKLPDKPVTVVAPPPAAELGRGTIDFTAIFKAAKRGAIKHYFVEQEEFDMPPFEALKIDADYMKALAV